MKRKRKRVKIIYLSYNIDFNQILVSSNPLKVSYNDFNASLTLICKIMAPAHDVSKLFG